MNFKQRLTFISAVTALFTAVAVQAVGTKSERLFDVRLTSSNLSTINMVGKAPSGSFTALCEAMCVANSSCKGWTRQGNSCFLKSSVSPSNYVQDATFNTISGVIR